MKKTITIMLIALIAIIGSVFAYQGYGMNSQSSTYEKGTYHEQVEEVLKDGTYDDLVNLREELGVNVMPMVESEEDFSLMQERHELMEEQGIEPGYMRTSGFGNHMRSSGSGYGQGKGMGNSGNCPYLN